MARALRIQSHVRSMLDPDGGVLLDLNAGKYYSLNVVGTQIWRKLEEKASPPEILAHLEQVFPVPRERLEADFEGFIQGLAKKGLLDVVP